MTGIKQNDVTKHDTEPMDDNKPLVMRKRIRSTTYDVYVYFSKTSRETLKDKIVRMARNEVLNKVSDTNDNKGNYKIEWTFVLEMYNNNIPVATIKRVKLKGKVMDGNNSLNELNNTMYVETDEGTEQVKHENGKLVFVE